MLYTKKGDNGTTKMFNTPKGKRISKCSSETEALGSLDELNSFLGILKVQSAGIRWKISGLKISDTIHWVQNCLFIIQAEIAGSDKSISNDKIMKLESLTDSMEKELPPIKTFFISGGTELAAVTDVCRTLARRAERRLVCAIEEGRVKVGPDSLSFMNRLSSFLYALARLTNHKSGINEQAPTY